MPSLNSSAISRVSYDPLTARLYITFHSGRFYTFYRVPHRIYQGLLHAASAGEYYNNYIRGRFGL